MIFQSYNETFQTGTSPTPLGKAMVACICRNSTICLWHYKNIRWSNQLSLGALIMNKNFIQKPLAAAIGAAFLTSVSAMSVAGTNQNPFSATQLNNGYMQTAAAEGKCGGQEKMNKTKEGKCGGNKVMKKSMEGKCGASKEMKKGKEGKCGTAKVKNEGKCGGKKGMVKSMEGKCGASKQAKKAKEGKCGEGKCGGKK